MKKLFAIISMIFVLLLTGCKINENIESTLPGNQDNQEQEILDSGDNNVNETPKLDSEIEEGYIDIINSMEAEIFNEDLKYDLVYFNNDDLSDLLVTKYTTSYVYTLENGELKTLVDGYSYGTWGRSPFYAPKMSLIKDYTYDMEGNTFTEYFDMNGRILEYANVYSIKTNVYTGEVTTEGKLDIELPEDDEFVGMEIKAEIFGKSVEEIEDESKEALIIGNEKYEEATKIYTGGLDYENETVPVSDYRGYKITNINEVKELFTDEKFDKYVGRAQDDSDNFNSIVEENGEFYRLDADRGGNQFYIKTILMPNVIEENKISFNAITYEVDYASSERMKQEDWDLLNNNPDEFLKKYLTWYVKVVNNRFTLIRGSVCHFMTVCLWSRSLSACGPQFIHM